MSVEAFRLEDEFHCPKCGVYAYFYRKYLGKGCLATGSRGGPVFYGPCIIRSCSSCDFEFSHQTSDGEINDRRGNDQAPRTPSSSQG